MHDPFRRHIFGATDLPRTGHLERASKLVQATLGGLASSLPRASAGLGSAPGGKAWPQAVQVAGLAEALKILPGQGWTQRDSGSAGAADDLAGAFIPGSFSNTVGTRSYKLYVPSGYAGQPLPLIVMLHGCTQSPDDFAAGTRMNAWAERQNCLVCYPAQSAAANASKCWNWFNAAEQQRDRGEPSLIVGIVRQIARDYAIDLDRIFAAGLSAGGAMAATLGELYPDVFAAIGVHSGLACGSASDVGSAFDAMRRGGHAAARGHAAMAASPGGRSVVPAIVFHGDRDNTVHPSNGDDVIEQALHSAALRTSVERGSVPGGRSYRRTLHHDKHGRVLHEQWTIHGAGHAWSGGSSDGSYTDRNGPDASREMLRFFLDHPRQAEATPV